MPEPLHIKGFESRMAHLVHLNPHRPKYDPDMITEATGNMLNDLAAHIEKLNERLELIEKLFRESGVTIHSDTHIFKASIARDLPLTSGTVRFPDTEAKDDGHE